MLKMYVLDMRNKYNDKNGGLKQHTSWYTGILWDYKSYLDRPFSWFTDE